MPSKQVVADTAYTYIKNSLKIMLALIPGVPDSAKLIDPVLDIAFNNMKWAGLFKEDMTVEQQVELRKAIKKAFDEIEKKTQKNKRELLERARPELEAIITENVTILSSREITDMIESILARPVYTEGEFFTNNDFDDLTKSFLSCLVKNLDNTPLAGTLNREGRNELWRYLREKFNENDSFHAEFSRKIQQLDDRFNDALKGANSLAGIRTGLMSNLPIRNHLFTGREYELGLIKAEFGDSGKQNVTLFQTIVGLGGIGKTSLAIEYAYQNTHDYPNLIWRVNVENENTTYADFLALSMRLKLFPVETEENVQPETVKKVIMSWLQEQTGWLLILDNAVEQQIVNDYLPSISSCGHVLVTTKDKQVCLGLQVELKEFSESEALSFFRKENQNDDDSILIQLTDELGYFPLALAQSNAYLKNCDISAESYIDLLSSKGLQVFSSANSRARDYQQIISTVWLATLEQLSESSRQFLKLCSCLNSELIPLRFFSETAELLPFELASTFYDEMQFNDMKAELIKFSLINYDEPGTTISIHKLLHDVIFEQCGHSEFSTLFEMMIKYLPHEYSGKQDFDRFRGIMIHGSSFMNKAIMKSEDSYKNLDYQLASKAFSFLGHGFSSLGLLEPAAIIAQNALAVYEMTELNEPDELAQLYNNLGFSYKEVHGYEIADEYYRIACNLVSVDGNVVNLLGATVYNNAALNSYYLKKPVDAHLRLDCALAFLETDEDKFCKELGVAYNSLGNVYALEKNNEEAFKYIEKSIKYKTMAFGEKSVFVANSIKSLAELVLLTDVRKALVMYKEARAIYASEQGEDHPNVATVDISIALCYIEMGRRERAIQSLKNVLRILIPLSHPDLKLAEMIANAIYQKGKRRVSYKDWIISLCPEGFDLSAIEPTLVDIKDISF